MRFLLLLLFLLLSTAPAQAMMEAQVQSLQPLEYCAFGEIPVLHEGRVKPLASFARAYLLAFSGKSALPGMGATAWLAETLFDPEKAYERPIFNIANPDVTDALSLPWREGHRYSFDEISGGIAKHKDTIRAVESMGDTQRTPSQRQLQELVASAAAYALLSESLSLMQPRFRIHDAGLAQKLHLPRGQNLTFLDIAPHEYILMGDIERLKHTKPADLTPAQREEAFLALDYTQVAQHQKSSLLRIVPPEWQRDGDAWFSPWAVLFEGHGSPQSTAYLDLWKKMGEAYANKQAGAWVNAAEAARGKAFELAGDRASPFRIRLESFYLRANLLPIALGLYIAAFALLTVFSLSGRRFFYLAAAWLMPLGAFLHLAGIAMRIIIMQRPPVATLYETTLFVSLIAVVLSLLFERKRRDGASMLVGSIIGAVLLFISTRYAAEGDTMEMLVAVLNTNFWLATHVVAVTAGYGCALVAGTLAHLYLLQRYFRPRDTRTHENILNGILAVCLIAAFFATLGTILGGIWADQSWGRFWGWDPKENGAMLIVLWLLWLLHGRIAQVLNPLNFASFALLTNVVVALSWFGVNLLSVGLHSYGFTSHIALNLGLFCGGEILFLAAMRGLLRVKA